MTSTQTDLSTAAERFLEREYDVDRPSLALVRIATAAWLLYGGIGTRSADVSMLPPALWDPALGPMRLLTSAPPRWSLVMLGWATTVALVALLFGLWVRPAGVLAGGSILIAEAVENSFGKVDHGFVLIAVFIALMSWSSWGDAITIQHSSGAAKRGAAWPLASTMLILSVMMTMAALPKLTSGWLDPTFSATQIRQLQGVAAFDKTDYLAGAASHFDIRAVWEAADWFAVVFESAFIFTVWRRRQFQVVLAFAAVFHLGVLLVLNISFTPHLLVYAAAFDWTRPAERIDQFARERKHVFGTLMTVGAVSIAAFGRCESRVPSVSLGLLLGAGTLGTAYLALRIVTIVNSSRNRSAPASRQPPERRQRRGRLGRARHR